MIAHIIATLRIGIGTVGLFFGYYELFGEKIIYFANQKNLYRLFSHKFADIA